MHRSASVRPVEDCGFDRWTTRLRRRPALLGIHVWPLTRMISGKFEILIQV
jgi:hypothetical protein